ncbi:MAG: putative RND superfamily exporter protein [Gammaproteobacteria bacterium]|jgi:predicted RND superfamily exporter protein
MSNIVSVIYDRTVLRFPFVVIVLLAGILAFFATHVPNFKLDASSDALLLENDQDLRRFRDVSERYKIQEFLFVTVTPNNDLFDRATIDLVGQIRDDFDALESVQSVTSMLDVPLVNNVKGKLADLAKNFRLLEYEDVDLELAREELTTSPIYRDLVVNAAGTLTAIQIFLTSDEAFTAAQKRRNELITKRDAGQFSAIEGAELDRILVGYADLKNASDAANHQAIADIRTIMAKYGDRATLHLGGVPMIVDDMVTFISNDLVTFGSGVAVFLVLMLTLIFREARWVVLPLLSCLYAGTIMVGFLGLVGWNVTIISSNFISLMLIITMSMNIHLIVRYRELMRDLPDDTGHYELVRETIQHMVRPCLYTALTTIIAFTSLVVSGIKPVIDFGWMMTIGVSVLFLTSFTLFPAVLLLLKKKSLRRPEGDNYALTAGLGKFTEKHGGVVLIGSAVIAVLGIVGIQKLEVENSFINYFHEDTEIYQGLKLIDESLGGTTPLDIILKFNVNETEYESDTESDPSFGDLEALFGEIESGDEDIWFTPAKVNRIKQVHDYLDGLEAVGKVLSLATVVRVAEDLNDGQEFDAFQLNVIYKRMPYVLRAAMIDPYVSTLEDEARISSRIYDSLPGLRRGALLARIDRELQESIGLAPNEYEITGLLVLYNNMLQSLFKSQIQTLGVVMLGILLMLWVLFRSFKVAVIGIIPNLLAACTILGLMGWMGIPLDMMTITIAAITIGIAVDDCIHYLYRFREEYPTSQDYVATMHYCHVNIAKAAFYTTITITVGFSILIMSNFIPTILFGVLTAVAMIIALVSALTLMAKLILVWRPF